MSSDHRATRYSRYRQGMCIDCGQRPHSAGRTRCDGCHLDHARNPLGANTNG